MIIHMCYYSIDVCAYICTRTYRERERGGGRGRKKCKTNEYKIKTNFKKQVEYDEASEYVLLS